jgi:hypothetical protein
MKAEQQVVSEPDNEQEKKSCKGYVYGINIIENLADQQWALAFIFL